MQEIDFIRVELPPLSVTVTAVRLISPVLGLHFALDVMAAMSRHIQVLFQIK